MAGYVTSFETFVDFIYKETGREIEINDAEILWEQISSGMQTEGFCVDFCIVSTYDFIMLYMFFDSNLSPIDRNSLKLIDVIDYEYQRGHRTFVKNNTDLTIYAYNCYYYNKHYYDRGDKWVDAGYMGEIPPNSERNIFYDSYIRRNIFDWNTKTNVDIYLRDVANAIRKVKYNETVDHYEVASKEDLQNFLLSHTGYKLDEQSDFYESYIEPFLLSNPKCTMLFATTTYVDPDDGTIIPQLYCFIANRPDQSYAFQISDISIENVTEYDEGYQRDITNVVVTNNSEYINIGLYSGYLHTLEGSTTPVWYNMDHIGDLYDISYQSSQGNMKTLYYQSYSGNRFNWNNNYTIINAQDFASEILSLE